MHRFLLLLVACTDVLVGQQIVVTNGTAGELCGTSRCRESPRPSVCVSNVCTCRCPFSKGFGFLQCATEGEEICSLYSDPLLFNYAGFHVHVPANYKFLLTKVSTRPCRQRPTRTVLADGSCEITVLAWGGHWKGKTFVQGVEIRYKVTEGARPAIFRNFRIYGRAQAGLYTFTVDGSDDPDPDSPGATYGDPINLDLTKTGSTYLDVEWRNNMVSLEGACGVRVSLRVVDGMRPVELVSGVSVIVNNRCEPRYLMPDSALCSSPSDTSNKFEALAESLTNLTGSPVTKSVAAMFFILRNIVSQNFPGSPAVLQNLTSLECVDSLLVTAVSRCEFIQELPPFVKCMTRLNDIDNKVSSLFVACVSSICARSVLGCDQVKVMIVNTNCLGLLPSFIGTILELSCAVLSVDA